MNLLDPTICNLITIKYEILKYFVFPQIKHILRGTVLILTTSKPVFNLAWVIFTFYLKIHGHDFG